MHDNDTQHEEVTIRTGIQAGDDGSQIGSGHVAGGGGLGSGSATGQMGSGG
ncbi:MAG TPA: hypothetical protein VGF28_21635 [Thermoanaerobaculia bacterium]|jgi:hypothetical protein